ncbi:MAG: hypothetical protein FJX19_07350 [Alphaproteobacteria bacterium]|nr:hypothetical protein [Alphaproteobacteria bacterium]
MRLRGIELTNVRRFAGKRASLLGIGDSVTVLSEPNESGKSTLFDALHAAFFERHRSRNAAILSLQPHAGGAPEVEVEIALPEGRFRIVKRWINRPHARVTDATGRPIALADEAEAWIDRLMGGGLAGPSVGAAGGFGARAGGPARPRARPVGAARPPLFGCGRDRPHDRRAADGCGDRPGQ